MPSVLPLTRLKPFTIVITARKPGHQPQVEDPRDAGCLASTFISLVPRIEILRKFCDTRAEADQLAIADGQKCLDDPSRHVEIRESNAEDIALQHLENLTNAIGGLVMDSMNSLPMAALTHATIRTAIDRQVHEVLATFHTRR